eukprot:1125509-Pleurochrysis_carterae.AAC.1
MNGGAHVLPLPPGGGVRGRDEHGEGHDEDHRRLRTRRVTKWRVLLDNSAGFQCAHLSTSCAARWMQALCASVCALCMALKLLVKGSRCMVLHSRKKRTAGKKERGTNRGTRGEMKRRSGRAE